MRCHGHGFYIHAVVFKNGYRQKESRIINTLSGKVMSYVGSIGNYCWLDGS